MNVIGNLFLGIATLVFLLLFNTMYLKTVPRGGDAAVGYAWVLILGVLAFSICMAIVTAIIGWQGGFDWVGGPRTMLVVAGFILILLGNGFFMMGVGEGTGDLPPVIRQILLYLPAVLPPVLLVAAGVLLNAERSSVPVLVYKLPIYFGLTTGLLALLIIAGFKIRNTATAIKASRQYENKIHQDHLNHIDTTDVRKEMVFLLVYTDANHPGVVRERALAKIKSRPDWQEELVRRLQNDWAPEAFTFLASNDVDDKAMFAEPIRQGIQIQAKLIRENIRQCRDHYSLYSGKFIWEVDRVLRTVDRFNNTGVDYRPAVQELRRALDEKTSFKKPELGAIRILEDWLKKH